VPTALAFGLVVVGALVLARFGASESASEPVLPSSGRGPGLAA
jgi:hypothetical protein